MSQREATRLAYRQRIQRAQQYLESRLDEPVHAEAIARVGGMSVHHFHRVFRGQTGESVQGYARRLRLERAARALRQSDRAIADIAFEAAYGSHEAFTRAFAAHYGQSPSAWRDGDGAGPGKACGHDVAPPEEVQVRREPPRQVVSMRHVGSYQHIGALWARLDAWWPEALGRGRQLALVPDDAQITEADKLRYDACYETVADIRRSDLPEGPVTLTTLPGGLYACATHVGSYARLHETYLALIGAWFPASGHALSIEPVIEHYQVAPPGVPEDALRTEVMVRIEERGWHT